MRGKQCYKPGSFTLGDLYKELAFDEVPWRSFVYQTISFPPQYTLLSLQRQLPTKPFAVVDMKGATLAEAVKQSRAGTHERPGFLHLDGDCHADEAHWELFGSTIPICAVVAKGCYQI